MNKLQKSQNELSPLPSSSKASILPAIQYCVTGGTAGIARPTFGGHSAVCLQTVVSDQVITPPSWETQHGRGTFGMINYTPTTSLPEAQTYFFTYPDISNPTQIVPSVFAGVWTVEDIGMLPWSSGARQPGKDLPSQFSAGTLYTSSVIIKDTMQYSGDVPKSGYYVAGTPFELPAREDISPAQIGTLSATGIMKRGEVTDDLTLISSPPHELQRFDGESASRSYDKVFVTGLTSTQVDIKGTIESTDELLLTVASPDQSPEFYVEAIDIDCTVTAIVPPTTIQWQVYNITARITLFYAYIDANGALQWPTVTFERTLQGLSAGLTHGVPTNQSIDFSQRVFNPRVSDGDAGNVAYFMGASVIYETATLGGSDIYGVTLEGEFNFTFTTPSMGNPGSVRADIAYFNNVQGCQFEVGIESIYYVVPLNPAQKLLTNQTEYPAGHYIGGIVDAGIRSIMQGYSRFFVASEAERWLVAMAQVDNVGRALMPSPTEPNSVPSIMARLDRDGSLNTEDTARLAAYGYVPPAPAMEGFDMGPTYRAATNRYDAAGRFNPRQAMHYDAGFFKSLGDLAKGIGSAVAPIAIDLVGDAIGQKYGSKKGKIFKGVGQAFTTSPLDATGMFGDTQWNTSADGKITELVEELSFNDPLFKLELGHCSQFSASSQDEDWEKEAGVDRSSSGEATPTTPQELVRVRKHRVGVSSITRVDARELSRYQKKIRRVRRSEEAPKNLSSATCFLDQPGSTILVERKHGPDPDQNPPRPQLIFHASSKPSARVPREKLRFNSRQHQLAILDHSGPKFKPINGEDKARLDSARMTSTEKKQLLSANGHDPRAYHDWHTTEELTSAELQAALWSELNEESEDESSTNEADPLPEPAGNAEPPPSTDAEALEEEVEDLKELEEKELESPTEVMVNEVEALKSLWQVPLTGYFPSVESTGEYPYSSRDLMYVPRMSGSAMPLVNSARFPMIAVKEGKASVGTVLVSRYPINTHGNLEDGNPRSLEQVQSAYQIISVPEMQFLSMGPKKVVSTFLTGARIFVDNTFEIAGKVKDSIVNSLLIAANKWVVSAKKGQAIDIYVTFAGSGPDHVVPANGIKGPSWTLALLAAALNFPNGGLGGPLYSGTVLEDGSLGAIGDLNYKISVAERTNTTVLITTAASVSKFAGGEDYIKASKVMNTVKMFKSRLCVASDVPSLLGVCNTVFAHAAPHVRSKFAKHVRTRATAMFALGPKFRSNLSLIQDPKDRKRVLKNLRKTQFSAIMPSLDEIMTGNFAGVQSLNEDRKAKKATTVSRQEWSAEQKRISDMYKSTNKYPKSDPTGAYNDVYFALTKKQFDAMGRLFTDPQVKQEAKGKDGKTYFLVRKHTGPMTVKGRKAPSMRSLIKQLGAGHLRKGPKDRKGQQLDIFVPKMMTGPRYYKPVPTKKVVAKSLSDLLSTVPDVDEDNWWMDEEEKQDVPVLEEEIDIDEE